MCGPYRWPLALLTLLLSIVAHPVVATLSPCLAAFAAHTVNSARFPVIQQKFDALLKAQLKGIPQSEVDKAKSIALPIAYATLEERWVHYCHSSTLHTHVAWTVQVTAS